MRLSVMTFVASSSFIVGCTSIESEDIETDGIHPSISVRSNEGSTDTSVSVSLHVGNSLTTFVDLSDEDQLAAVVGDQPLTLQENNLLGAIAYSASAQTQEPGTNVEVSFTRAEHDSAPSSTVTLTQKLTMTAPAGAEAFSRQDDVIEVAWSSEASDDPVRVVWSGGCVQSDSRDVTAGATSLSIAASSIQKSSADDAPDQCDVTLSVERRRAGVLDPAFGGGSIEHIYADSVTFSSTP